MQTEPTTKGSQACSSSFTFILSSAEIVDVMLSFERILREGLTSSAVRMGPELLILLTRPELIDRGLLIGVTGAGVGAWRGARSRTGSTTYLVDVVSRGDLTTGEPSTLWLVGRGGASVDEWSCEGDNVKLSGFVSRASPALPSCVLARVFSLYETKECGRWVLEPRESFAEPKIGLPQSTIAADLPRLARVLLLVIGGVEDDVECVRSRGGWSDSDSLSCPAAHSRLSSAQSSASLSRR
jgi:hypothetical protein